MNQIINVQNIEGKLLVSSRDIGENFEKQHKHVLEAIEELKKGIAEKSAYLFKESKYQHPQNKQWYKEYLITRDGFTLLAMGFNGKKALDWKVKYIEAFNIMEEELRENKQNQYKNLSPEIKALLMHDVRIQEMQKEVITVKDDLNEFKDDIPLFTVECEEISKAVKRVGTKVLGGHGSTAYNNKSVRAKVYSDIHRQLKREFDVNSYKAIKRKYLSDALDIVDDYNLTIALKEQINMLNEQASFA